MRKFYNIIFISLIISIAKSNNKFLKKRNLSEFTPKDLKIFLDFTNFEDNFENTHLGNTKDKFKNSMIEAQNILEKIFLISVDDGEDTGPEIDGSFKVSKGITSWNESIFVPETGATLNVNEYNLFILFKFDDLINVDMYSKIICTYTYEDIPVIGLVIINNNIDQSKLNQNYLKFLFLQQFIKILGFHIPNYCDETDYEGPITADIENRNDELESSGADNALVNKDTAEKVINYAKEYFKCDSIEEIELELDEYNNVYWPSKIFSGDIMTKFNSYQEKFISGFTLALLEDTGYLRVKESNAYTSGLMISGKNQGCECFFSGNCQIVSDDDDKLSTGAIIGIVFGCVGFILIVLGIIYYILKKGKKDNQITQLNNEEKIIKEKVETDNIYNNNNQHDDEIQIEDVDKQNQVEIHSKAKRKISNK